MEGREGEDKSMCLSGREGGEDKSMCLSKKYVFKWKGGRGKTKVCV